MEIMKAFLEELGCHVDSAFNGQQAVDMFKASYKGGYHMIFMDVMMPVLNGLEATHLIRTCGHADSGTIPIIAVSANAFDEDISRSLASGMNAHLSKPIDPQKLRQARSSSSLPLPSAAAYSHCASTETHIPSLTGAESSVSKGMASFAERTPSPAVV